MSFYFIIKTIHVLSATILFGTGIGIAFFMFQARFSSDPGVHHYIARQTVIADYFFTLPAVIIQPLSGAWLIWKAGFNWTDSVRLIILPSLQPLAPKLLKLATLFNLIGSNDSGFFIEMRDLDPSRRLLFEIVARSEDGLYIPCTPPVVLVKKLIKEEINIAGAYPCVGFVTLDEYLAMLKAFNIEWRLERTT